MGPRKTQLDTSSGARVQRACQRCKMKKTKCDGSYPCYKCKHVDEVCIYGAIKRHSRPKPRGYVDLMEAQQRRLGAGLQLMYRRLKDAQLWEGPDLVEERGKPSIIDILEVLNELDPLTDDESGISTATESFGSSTSAEKFSMPEQSEQGDRSESNETSSVVSGEPQPACYNAENELDLYNMVNWDTEIACTPWTVEPTFHKSNTPNQEVSNPVFYTGLRDYSAQMMETQARQAGLLNNI